MPRRKADHYILNDNGVIFKHVKKSISALWHPEHPLTALLWPRFIFRTSLTGVWRRERENFPYWEIKSVTAGEFVWRVGGEQFHIGRGETIIVPPGGHTLMTDFQGKNVTWEGMELHGQGLCALQNLTAAGRAQVVENPRLFHQIWKKVFTLLEARNMDASGEISALCYQLIAELTAQSAVPATPHCPSGLQKALDAIERAPEKNFSCQDLAQLAGCSVALLHRMFQEHLHIAPQQYIMRRKMTLAREMLLVGEMRIKEIAYRLGFSDPGYFTRVYRKFSCVDSIISRPC